jgi:hypothetical protein
VANETAVAVEDQAGGAAGRFASSFAASLAAAFVAIVLVAA